MRLEEQLRMEEEWEGTGIICLLQRKEGLEITHNGASDGVDPLPHLKS